LAEGPTGNTARTTFTIPEAHYETAWFRGLVVLGFLSLVGGVYAWRVRALRRRERKLQRLVDERTWRLAEEKEKTEEQARRLEALDTEKNRFFANVSHELRTPLTILRGSIKDLLDGAFGQISVAVREQLEIARSNAERMHRLTDQLLDLAHLETAEPTLDPEPRDLVALLRRTTRRFVPMAERRGLRLDLETEMDAHPCRVDPEKVEKIAGNLVSNALKNTPEGGRVTVRLAVEEGAPPETVLHVTDTGPGLPSDQQDKIFERFVRAGDGASTQEGMGLGLALAREYAELHDGTVEVDSTPGEGSTFTVRLPLPTVDPEAVEGGDVLADGSGRDAGLKTDIPSPSGDGIPEDAPDRPVLLVVEDNDDVRAYLRRHLANDYHLVEAEDGTEGIGKAQDAEPDLILTDLMMPGMGGIELCRRVREDEALARTPVVLLTARADEDDAVAGLEAGADAYVTKPFSIEELQARLRRLLEAHWAGASDDESARHPSPEVEATAADEQFLDRVTTAIDEHLSRAEFTVDDLAAEVGLSPRQLQRKLKRITGTTPAAFVRRYRLDVAAQLLEQEAGTVSEVAYEVGFGTPKTFARRFKERFGCPPSKYPEASSADAPE
jgi:signal transduction histidine kinase/DNA-binding response OmpR family regulator